MHDTLRCLPPIEATNGLILELLEPEPIALAEEIALEFHADCIAALDGFKLSAGNFVLSAEFKAIRANLRDRVGQAMATRIMDDWFYNKRDLFL